MHWGVHFSCTTFWQFMGINLWFFSQVHVAWEDRKQNTPPRAYMSISCMSDTGHTKTCVEHTFDTCQMRVWNMPWQYPCVEDTNAWRKYGNLKFWTLQRRPGLSSTKQKQWRVCALQLPSYQKDEGQSLLPETEQIFMFCSENGLETRTRRKTPFSTDVLISRGKKQFMEKRLAFRLVSQKKHSTVSAFQYAQKTWMPWNFLCFSIYQSLRTIH